MARTPLTLSSATPTGRQVSYAAVAAADGALFLGHNGRQRFLLRNGGGAPVTVTVVTGATISGLPVDDRVIIVPAGQDFVAGPFPADLYNQIGTDELHMDVSGPVSIAVLE